MELEELAAISLSFSSPSFSSPCCSVDLAVAVAVLAVLVTKIRYSAEATGPCVSRSCFFAVFANGLLAGILCAKKTGKLQTAFTSSALQNC